MNATPEMLGARVAALAPLPACGLEQIRRIGGPVAVPWQPCCVFGLLGGATSCVLAEPPTVYGDALLAGAEP